jgi:glucose-6-phosphate isomerase
MLTKTAEWQELKKHFNEIKEKHIRELFEQDKNRIEKFVIEDVGLYVDFSKNIISEKTLELLIKVAEARNLAQKIEDMFCGKNVNNTENRPALHVALRDRSGRAIYVNGKNIMQDVKGVLKKAELFAEELRSGIRKGLTGKRIRYVVNIGIGGSDLGPSAVYEALRDYSKKDIAVFFLSNVDPAQIKEVLEKVPWEETLFIVASKTFTTLETMTNAETIKRWLLKNSKDRNVLKYHFAAATSNKDAALEFGIDPENVFLFWDWIGGRYSVCSSVGLPVMIGIGKERFSELLDGFYQMDQHFRNRPFHKNIPVILGLINIWYNNFFGAQSFAVIPYSYRLRKLVLHLQQLDMESNGKSIDKEGNPVSYDTGPIVWGGMGTNSQHAFFQLLHQGTRLIPIDFIGFFRPVSSVADHHEKLISNMFAQAEALAFGSNEGPLYKRCPGNKPSNIIMAEKLTPSSIGKIIALYEHRTFVQACIWNINPFDQWGVELGKKLAKEIIKELSSGQIGEHDPSTRRLIFRYRQLNP